VKVLVADALDPAALERLRAAGHEVLVQTGLQGPALIAALAGVDALLVRGATRVTAEVLRGADALKLVVRVGTGLDNIDQDAARARHIRVANTPAANAVSVAELVFGLLLAFERRIPDAGADLRRGAWEKGKYEGRELAGRRLGIVGFGRIGREVAVRARAFAMGVAWCDPFVLQSPAGFEWARRTSLEELLPEADVVTLHLPLGERTRGLIGAAEIAVMRPEALLVNCARGGLVDEGALLAALRAGRLRGALLDVFETEPPGPHPLLALPNVLATPHLGASTLEAQARAADEAVEILLEALPG
jgi:D-3-phosphoglycerate dehydrogenase / 2-oxoglutarate reductase